MSSALRLQEVKGPPLSPALLRQAWDREPTRGPSLAQCYGGCSVPSPLPGESLLEGVGWGNIKPQACRSQQLICRKPGCLQLRSHQDRLSRESQ